MPQTPRFRCSRELACDLRHVPSHPLGWRLNIQRKFLCQNEIYKENENIILPFSIPRSGGEEYPFNFELEAPAPLQEGKGISDALVVRAFSQDMENILQGKFPLGLKRTDVLVLEHNSNRNTLRLFLSISTVKEKEFSLTLVSVLTEDLKHKFEKFVNRPSIWVYDVALSGWIPKDVST